MIDGMATDVEESDTDDYERPVPPKRQCTKLVNPSQQSCDSPMENESLVESVGSSDKTEECNYDEVERLARQKLTIWQECQVATGFLDNTINCVVEDYFLNPPVTYPTIEDSHYSIFRSREMEDTAVMMAILNHGLVHSDEMEQRMQSNAAAAAATALCVVDRIPGSVHACCSNNKTPEFSYSRANDRLPPMPIDEAENRASSSTRSIEIEARRVETSCWNENNKVDESDQEQDFWERAVAEAIKKKGLSALSVDYG